MKTRYVPLYTRLFITRNLSDHFVKYLRLTKVNPTSFILTNTLLQLAVT